MEIINCIFCIVQTDCACPYCGGLGIAALDPMKGMRPLTDTELLATCEASAVEKQTDERAVEAAS